MTSVAGIFLGVAMITLLGFFGSLLARRGRYPDLLVLVLIGLFIGPINQYLLHWGPLESAVRAIPIEDVTPVFGALALAVIMFDAGLNLHIQDTLNGLGAATRYTIAVFVPTVALVAIAAHVLLGFPFLVAILFGAILGGTSTAVVTAVTQNLALRKDTRTTLLLECLLVDVLSIAVAVAVIEALRGGALDGAKVAQSVVQSIAVAITLGLGTGLTFTFSLPRMRGVANLYVLTIGALLGLYALVEMLGGSGPIAVLSFGLVLGNSRNPFFGGRDLAPELSDEIAHVHRQISFLVRTFFFVLLGLTFSVAVVTQASALQSTIAWLAPWAGSWKLLLLGIVGVYLAIVVPRALVTRFAPLGNDRLAASLLVGRGLGSAVLATFPFTLPEALDPSTPYARALGPYREIFPTLVSVLVILTVLTTVVATIFVKRHEGPATTLRIAEPTGAAGTETSAAESRGRKGRGD